MGQVLPLWSVAVPSPQGIPPTAPDPAAKFQASSPSSQLHAPPRPLAPLHPVPASSGSAGPLGHPASSFTLTPCPRPPCCLPSLHRARACPPPHVCTPSSARARPPSRPSASSCFPATPTPLRSRPAAPLWEPLRSGPQQLEQSASTPLLTFMPAGPKARFGARGLLYFVHSRGAPDRSSLWTPQTSHSPHHSRTRPWPASTHPIAGTSVSSCMSSPAYAQPRRHTSFQAPRAC